MTKEIEFVESIDNEEFKVPKGGNPHDRISQIIDRSPTVIFHLEKMVSILSFDLEQREAAIVLVNSEEKVALLKHIVVSDKGWQEIKKKLDHVKAGLKLWEGEFIGARKKFIN